MSYLKFLLITLLAFGLQAGAAYATFPGLNGPIAYQVGNNGLVTVKPDGSAPTQLTRTVASGPSSSPDGRKIAFANGAFAARSEGIFLIGADGGDLTRLTNQNDGSPSFSPDGLRIVFSSMRNGTNGIYSMKADGSNQTRLSNPGSSSIDWSPSYSPDGSKIVFYRADISGLNARIFVMNSDGSDQTDLGSVDGYGPDPSPSFSPDGTRIAFHLWSDPSSTSEIYTMNTDGSNRTRLTRGPDSNSFFPSFSPDGSKIVYYQLRGGTGYESAEISVMNADGTQQTSLQTLDSANLLRLDGSIQPVKPDWGVLSATGTTRKDPQPGVRPSCVVRQANRAGLVKRVRLARGLRIGLNAVTTKDAGKLELSLTFGGSKKTWRKQGKLLKQTIKSVTFKNANTKLASLTPSKRTTFIDTTRLPRGQSKLMVTVERKRQTRRRGSRTINITLDLNCT